jgi:predicted XRE-type DNA-binding protein
MAEHPRSSLSLVCHFSVERVLRNARPSRASRVVSVGTKPKPDQYRNRQRDVFADVWLPRPEQELLKAKLTLEIYRILRERELKQAEAGKILGIKQPHVSLLMRNRAGTFSVERLMDFLTALGQDVKITVKPAKGKLGKVSLAA